MSSIDYIAELVESLTEKYQTRDPFKICEAMDIKIKFKNLGTLKAYYFYQSRIRNIVINSRVSNIVQKILAAHELGHDRLHQRIAMLKGFQEFELFDKATPTEYEANIFAAELLIGDKELREMFNDENKSFFDIAK